MTAKQTSRLQYAYAGFFVLRNLKRDYVTGDEFGFNNP